MIIHIDIYVSRFPKNKNMHTMKKFEGILWNFQNKIKSLMTCTQ